MFQHAVIHLNGSFLRIVHRKDSTDEKFSFTCNNNPHPLLITNKSIRLCMVCLECFAWISYITWGYFWCNHVEAFSSELMRREERQPLPTARTLDLNSSEVSPSEKRQRALLKIMLWKKKKAYIYVHIHTAICLDKVKLRCIDPQP